MKLVVEIKDAVEIYPADPNPWTVDTAFAVVNPPGEAPLIEETLKANVLRVWNRPTPATSRATPVAGFV